MLLIFIRSVITFIILFVVVRLMGKRQIGEMQPYELVITLVIAELACIPMSDSQIPLMYGIIAILTLLAAHQIISLISRKSITLRKVICGRPTIIITPNGVDFKRMKSLDMSISDLLEAMRDEGYFCFDQIRYGIMETNGKFSVLAKNDKKLQSMQELPMTFIEEGKIIKNTLQTLRLTTDWVYDVLRQNNVPKIKNVLIGMVNNSGHLYMQTKSGKPIIKESAL